MKVKKTAVYTIGEVNLRYCGVKKVTKNDHFYETDTIYIKLKTTHAIYCVEHIHMWEKGEKISTKFKITFYFCVVGKEHKDNFEDTHNVLILKLGGIFLGLIFILVCMYAIFIFQILHKSNF